MPKAAFLRVFLLILFSTASCVDRPAPHSPPPVALHEALSTGKVELRFLGSVTRHGRHIVGDSTRKFGICDLEITVQRRVPEPLEIYLAPGTLFESQSESITDIVAGGVIGEIRPQLMTARQQTWTISPSILIHLKDDAAHHYAVEGFRRDRYRDYALGPYNSGFSDYILRSPDSRATTILNEGRRQSAWPLAIEFALMIDGGGVLAPRPTSTDGMLNHLSQNPGLLGGGGNANPSGHALDQAQRILAALD